MLITKTTSYAPGKSEEVEIKQAGTKPIFWIAAALLLASVWVPRLFRSLWVDEAGTFFMAYRGPLEAIRVTAHWPGQSILYAVIASFFAFNGGPVRDVALRIPSLVGVLLAALFLYRLAEKGVGKHAGFLAAVIFLFHPTAIILGTQARPYALALAAVAGSCLALYEWVENRERRYLFGYVVASTLIV
jgi:4-amino-4-deoxy-L-arabinose transferase-like glycosyltransferase